MVRPVEDERGIGKLPNHLVARQVGPLALEQVIRIRVRSRVGGFGRDQRAAAKTKVRVLDVIRQIELVLRGHLVGEADARRAVVLLLWRRPAQVRRIERSVLRQVVIVRRHQVCVTKPTNRRKEPQLVSHDRPADSHVAIVGAISRVHGLQTAGL